MFKELGETVGIPIFPKIVYPELRHRFWVLLIGKGYAPPSVRFRWCSEKMKIRPVREFIKGLKTKYGEYPVVLTGVRLDEGSNRKTSLLKRVNGKWMPYEGLQECSVFAPLLNLSTEDIWSYIEYNERKWNVDLSYLRELYSIASDGINSFRTGCWVCTLVRKDKSLTKLSERKPELKALVKFRDFLYELRANKNLRMWVTRFGKTYKGPLKFDVRRFLFEIVKSMNCLTIEEEMKILEIWKESGFIRSNRIVPIEFERCRNCDLNYVFSPSPKTTLSPQNVNF